MSDNLAFTIGDDNRLLYRGSDVGVVGMMEGEPIVRFEGTFDVHYEDLADLSALKVFIGVWSQPQRKEAKKKDGKSQS